MPLTETTVLQLFRSLRGFGALAWRQIRPSTLAALVAEHIALTPGAAGELTEIVGECLAAYGRERRPAGLADARAELALLEDVESSHDEP